MGWERERVGDMAKVESQLITADCLEWMRGQPDARFDLVLGSPPYVDARLYLEGGENLGISRDAFQWVDWMLNVTTEAHRICKGPVLWVVAGVTRDRCYWPACEGLAWEWFKRGGDCHLYRPCIFHRVGIPGSGGDDWFRADWEFVLCFKHPGKLPWSDNTACGHKPKWAPGGEMSYRNSAGTRRNQWVHSGTGEVGSRTPDGERQPQNRPSHVIVNGRDQWGGTPTATSGSGRYADGDHKTPESFRHAEDGSVKGSHARDIPRPRKAQTRRKPNGERPGADGGEQDYMEPVLANPGNVVTEQYSADDVARIIDEYESGDWRHEIVGGGVMGSKLAHLNEAPYSESLVEFFIRSLCPHGGWVLDPFSGSGTTVSVSKRFGRNAVGIDLRESQTKIGQRRIKTAQPELFA